MSFTLVVVGTISQHRLEGVSLNLVQPFIQPTGRTVMNLVITTINLAPL